MRMGQGLWSGTESLAGMALLTSESLVNLSLPRDRPCRPCSSPRAIPVTRVFPLLSAFTALKIEITARPNPACTGNIAGAQAAMASPPLGLAACKASVPGEGPWDPLSLRHHWGSHRLFLLQGFVFPSSPVVTLTPQFLVCYCQISPLEAQALFYGHWLQLERKVPQFHPECIISWLSAPNDFSITLSCDAKRPEQVEEL